MKIVNRHQRKFESDLKSINALMATLSSREDKVIACEYWPRMKMDKGLQIGSRGGHGPIGYWVSDIQADASVTFTFTKPHGFEGHHIFEVMPLNEKETTVMHTINMNTTTLAATLQWLIAIRWLHDAFIEDAFDKIEYQFSGIHKKPQWSEWVKFLRFLLG